MKSFFWNTCRDQNFFLNRCSILAVVLSDIIMKNSLKQKRSKLTNCKTWKTDFTTFTRDFWYHFYKITRLNNLYNPCTSLQRSLPRSLPWVNTLTSKEFQEHTNTYYYWKFLVFWNLTMESDCRKRWKFPSLTTNPTTPVKGRENSQISKIWGSRDG